MVIPDRIYQRVISKADLDPATGCHVSRYSVGSHGYAQVGWSEGGRRTVTLCHLVVWKYLNGPVPEGMTVDHVVCHNYKCINPDHLRLLTNFENARRTLGRNWPLGECAQGHPNSSLFREPSGRTRCKDCARISSRKAAQARYDERRAAGLPQRNRQNRTSF